MRFGLTFVEALALICSVVVLIAFFVTPYKSISKHEDMIKSGCRVIDYAGAHANIKVYRCPGYEDVVSKRDWTGPRTVEKQ